MSITTTPDDVALKAKHRAMWALGDYAAVASEIIAEVGEVLVEPPASRPASGSSTWPPAPATPRCPPPAAAPTSSPPTSPPSCSRSAAPAAEAEGLTLTLGDRRRRGAAVRRRVVRRGHLLRGRHVRPAPPGRRRRAGPGDPLGGTIGLLSWTPEGFIGQMFATMKPYAPPPPPGAQPPPLWGHVDHVRELCSATGSPTSTPASRRCGWTTTPSGRSSATTSRPTTAPPSRSTRRSRTTPSGSPPSTRSWPPWATASLGDGAMDWEYLLVTARRA